MARDCGCREPGTVRADFLVERRGFEMIAIVLLPVDDHSRDVLTVPGAWRPNPPMVDFGQLSVKSEMIAAVL